LVIVSLVAAAAMVGFRAGGASADPVLSTTIPVGASPRNVALSPDGEVAYVSNANGNSVSVINTVTQTVTATIAGFSTPQGVAVSPDGSRLYVVNQGTSSVLVVNTTTNLVVATISVGSFALDVDILPNGSRLYVTNALSDTVSVIDTSTNTVVATLTGFDAPTRLAVAPDGTYVYISDSEVNTVRVIRTSDNATVATIPVGGVPGPIAVSPVEARAYVINTQPNTVSVIDTSTNTVVSTIGPIDGLTDVATSPDGAQIYLSSALDFLYVIDAATNIQTSAVALTGFPRALGIHPDGSRAYVTQSNAASVAVVALQPSPPTSVTATPGVNKLNVSWQAPSYTGGQAITSYLAKAKPGGQTCTSASTSCGIEGLTPGTPYTVTVTATNTIGTSMASEPSASVTPVAQARIIISKQADPATDTTTEFTFNPSWSLVDFMLKNNGTKDTALDPGTYSITENALAGWDLTSATCDDGSEVSAIGLAAGETVTCTFSNTQRGHIIVAKTTLPSDDVPEFTFDPSWGDTFTLNSGDQNDSGALKPDTYSVTENPLFGWDLVTAQCSGDGNTPSRIVLGAGKTVTCTFTNVKQTAQLRLVKNVDGGSAKPEDWLLSATAAAPYAGRNIEDAPGNNTEYAPIYADVDYDLSESAGPAKYTPATWECVQDQVPGVAAADVVLAGRTVRLDPGTWVTCTITNVRDSAELKLVKQVEGKASANDWTLTAAAAAPDNDRNISTPGGAATFERVYAGTQYTLGETGPTGYTAGQWTCEGFEVMPQLLQSGDKITLSKGDRVTCTIVNVRDTGSLTITKEFNAQTSGFMGTFDVTYSCVDGAEPVKSGTVKLGAGQSETIARLPTGTTCTVTEPKVPASPPGWRFNTPSFVPANGQATVTAKDQAVSVTVINTLSQVDPVVVKTVCPIEPVLARKGKSSDDRRLIKRIKTNRNNCVLLKPVVLCKPLGSAAAGETAFCKSTVTRSGRVTVTTKGYDAVRVTVVVRVKPKPGSADTWRSNTWRERWSFKR